MSGVLYLSYDGMLEPLGQSQVLAYLERLAPDYAIHLVSFEKAEDWAKPQLRAAVEARMRAAGISWHPLRYHKAPSALATAYDIAQGIRIGAALVRRHGKRPGPDRLATGPHPRGARGHRLSPRGP